MRTLLFVQNDWNKRPPRADIEAGLKMAGNTVRPRVRELLDRHLIRVVGVRRNAAGLTCEVLVLN